MIEVGSEHGVLCPVLHRARGRAGGAVTRPHLHPGEWNSIVYPSPRNILGPSSGTVQLREGSLPAPVCITPGSLHCLASPGGGGCGGEADRGGDLEAEHGAGVATDSQH